MNAHDLTDNIRKLNGEIMEANRLVDKLSIELRNAQLKIAELEYKRYCLQVEFIEAMDANRKES